MRCAHMAKAWMASGSWKISQKSKVARAIALPMYCAASTIEVPPPPLDSRCATPVRYATTLTM